MEVCKMRLYHRESGIELTQEEMIELGNKSGIMGFDIECVLFDTETNTGYILDECGNYAYIDTDKYLIK
jgi:hypothetical protein